jgi:hypothetical protein
MALPVVRVRHHQALSSTGADDVLVSVSVGAAGQAVALWSTAEDRALLASTTTRPGGARFPDPRTPRPVGARVTTHTPGRGLVVRIPDLPLAHPTVQLLPGDRILVVAARCRWRPSGPDRNAIVYDGHGQVVAAQTLGDGIARVLTTASGQVWVGYFDEGVYGNYGWGDAGAPAPVGRRGLVRFSADLQPEWHYPSHMDHPWGAISDCYALNVDGDIVRVCYYMDFPVVRIDADELTGWHNTVAGGVRALIASGPNVGLYGGYGPDRDRLVVAATGDRTLHKLAEYRLVLPDGSPMPNSVRVVGRGPDLHLFVERDWYRVALDDIPPDRHR